MFNIISAIIGFINLLTRAVDFVNAWLDARQAEKVDETIDQSVVTGDQTPIEQAMGNPNAGKPTKENIPDLKVRPVGEHGKH